MAIVLGGAVRLVRTQSTTISASQPARAPALAPAAVPTSHPTAPRQASVSIDQNGWCEPIVIPKGLRVKWHISDPNAWLDMRINGSQEYRQPPFNDARWKATRISNRIDSLEFMIPTGTRVKNALVQYAVGISLTNVQLPSLQPPPKKDTSWPIGDLPTREITIPPPGYVFGTEVTDTIYPIEDVYYRIEPDWAATPNADTGANSIQIAPLKGGIRSSVNNQCDGLRIRVSAPGMNPVTIRFSFAPQ